MNSESTLHRSNDSVENDAIGDTVYSKRWLRQCLLKLIEFVEREAPKTLSANETNEDALQHSFDQLEDELCLLWDISSNEDVQTMFIEYKAEHIFINSLMKTEIPRLAEISIGILANIAYKNEISQLISNDVVFCPYVIALVGSSDIPFLVQVLRFMNTILTKQGSKWLEVIEENGQIFFSNATHLLSNCLNVELLKLLFQLLNKLFYLDCGNLGKMWRNGDHEVSPLGALCQACFHLISSLDGDLADQSEELPSSEYQFFFHFWFIVQSLLDVDDIDHDFFACLTELKELFMKYDYISDQTINSISSYSAACSVFTVMLNVNLEDHSRPIKPDQAQLLRSLRDNMPNNRELVTMHHKISSNFVQQKTSIALSDRNYQLVLENLNQFSQLIST